jgi:putative ABC transport system substrate-binding protein
VLPIVFVSLRNTVRAGLINSLARPGSNITGSLVFEFGMGVKRLLLHKEVAPQEVAPQTTRVAAHRAGQWGAIQTAALSVGVELIPIDVRDAGEIEHTVRAFARSPNGGLIVTGDALAAIRRDVIIKVAARHRLIYYGRLMDQWFSRNSALIRMTSVRGHEQDQTASEWLLDWEISQGILDFLCAV